MTFTVSPATLQDHPEMVQLVAQAAHDPLSADPLRKAFERPQAHILTCRDEGGALVGYSLYWVVADETDIHGVVVDPNQRRRGIGSRLIQQVIAHAQSKDCAHIGLELRKSNTGALALYRSLGFESVGTRTDSYRLSHEGAVLMRRMLQGKTTGV